ncbi:MAG: hypothetical protein UHX00_05260 [Caryophanon sp.]|nr:hypothetical protein [Caryophanon sp.]
MTNDPYEEYREQPQGCGTFIAGGLALIVFLVLVMCSMNSCKCPECLTTTETERIVKVVERDTTILTKADSASIKALFKCDSAYNVVMFELVSMQGERIEASVNATKQGKNLAISLDCREDSLEQEIHLRDSIISTTNNNTTVIWEKYVPTYYKRTSAGFWVLLAIVVAVAGYKISKIIIKIKSGGLL